MSVIILTSRRDYNSVSLSSIFSYSFPILLSLFYSIFRLLFCISLIY
nr:MAG TPA: hypothetical protein [Caudoviricetes sp.]